MKCDELHKRALEAKKSVVPAQAGTQGEPLAAFLDPHLRGDDG